MNIIREVALFIKNGYNWRPYYSYTHFCDMNRLPTGGEDCKQCFNEIQDRFEKIRELIMPKFKCTNKDCDRFDIEFIEPKVAYSWQSGGMKPVKPIFCSKCESDCEEIKEHKEGIPMFGQFSSLPQDKKREILTKRARAHDKKIKEETKYRNDKAVDDLKKGAGL